MAIHNRVISTWICKQLGFKKNKAITGSVTLLQRFGSGLNLNTHFHTLALDGCYTIEDDKKVFHPLPMPQTEDIEKILATIINRVLLLLEKRGLLTKDEEQASLTLDHETSAMDRLQSSSIVYKIAYGPRAGQKVFELKALDLDQKQGSKNLLANSQGFSLHAGTRCAAHERKRLEFLCRYITRPAIAEERLSQRPDGKIVLRLKTPYRDRTTHLVFTPLELLQRLAALVPRPRIHLARFHGIFAPHAKHRKAIVPHPEADADSQACSKATDDPPKPKRMTWARLLARVFNIDVETCSVCSHKYRIIAAILERGAIEKILTHLGLPTIQPPIALARPPPLFAHADQSTPLPT
ncbi:MAG: hypothetical protein B7X10_02325 [Burkholderiales bacterium 21-58-4]|nr:MAG: hypothetical protein B7X10_02325 [Burkholderiales bacterium 21-58-4]